MRQTFTVNLSFWRRVLILFTGRIYFKHAVFIDDPGEFINIHTACSLDSEFVFKVEGEQGGLVGVESELEITNN